MKNLGVPVINNKINSGDTIESTKCRYKYTSPMDRYESSISNEIPL